MYLIIRSVFFQGIIAEIKFRMPPRYLDEEHVRRLVEYVLGQFSLSCIIISAEKLEFLINYLSFAIIFSNS